MRVLMLGWEFPPFISGGLGTACYGLTRAMGQLDMQVLFVLPRTIDLKQATHVTLLSPSSVGPAPESSVPSRLEGLEGVTFRTVDAHLAPYSSPTQHQQRVERGLPATITYQVTTPGQTRPRPGPVVDQPAPTLPPPLPGSGPGEHYSGDLFAEADRYARLCVAIARGENFDVVHAHDWMTFPAGIAVARFAGKPLIVHVHSTEFDRSGEHVNQRIYNVERQGAHAADRVIAVSHLTKNILTLRYAVPADHVEVVYNAINENNGPIPPPPPIRRDDKIVLFLGRITMQKGPEYFIAAAKKVLELMDNVRFVMAGTGDMVHRTIELAAQMGIGHKVLFTGFLRGDDVTRVFKMADLYVMPSVSEPFGIAPLEALSHDVPVIISKQSGVAEVLTHALKVDFWDIDEMANKIVAVLRHPPLHATLREHGHFEIRKLTWRDSAERCLQVYREVLSARGCAVT